MDLWGAKNVGIITARQMTTVMPASFAGPFIATRFRESSLLDAARDLSSQVQHHHHHRDSIFHFSFAQLRSALKSFFCFFCITTITITTAITITRWTMWPSPRPLEQARTNW
jgi:hypothetical protein